MDKAGQLTNARAMLFAYMSGHNNQVMNEVQFTNGCRRFGVDNPMPTVKKRIALYGNSQTVTTLVREVSEKQSSVKLGTFTPANFIIGAGEITKEAKDLKETEEPKPR